MFNKRGQNPFHIRLTWLGTKIKYRVSQMTPSSSRRMKHVVYEIPRRCHRHDLTHCWGKVYQILIDNDTYASILFKSTLNMMNLIRAKIKPIASFLSWFTGDNVSSEGILNLPVEVGTSPCQHIQSVDFALLIVTLYIMTSLVVWHLTKFEL